MNMDMAAMMINALGALSVHMGLKTKYFLLVLLRASSAAAGPFLDYCQRKCAGQNALSRKPTLHSRITVSQATSHSSSLTLNENGTAPETRHGPVAPRIDSGCPANLGSRLPPFYALRVWEVGLQVERPEASQTAGFPKTVVSMRTLEACLGLGMKVLQKSWPLDFTIRARRPVRKI